jgi:hypothetical protein
VAFNDNLATSWTNYKDVYGLSLVQYELKNLKEDYIKTVEARNLLIKERVKLLADADSINESSNIERERYILKEIDMYKSKMEVIQKKTTLLKQLLDSKQYDTKHFPSFINDQARQFLKDNDIETNNINYRDIIDFDINNDDRTFNKIPKSRPAPTTTVIQNIKL